MRYSQKIVPLNIHFHVKCEEMSLSLIAKVVFHLGELNIRRNFGSHVETKIIFCQRAQYVAYPFLTKTTWVISNIFFLFMRINKLTTPSKLVKFSEFFDLYNSQNIFRRNFSFSPGQFDQIFWIFKPYPDWGLTGLPPIFCKNNC